jgi:hypothetical protein
MADTFSKRVRRRETLDKAIVQPEDRATCRICTRNDLFVWYYHPVIWLAGKVGGGNMRAPLSVPHEAAVHDRYYVGIHGASVANIATFDSMLIASRRDPCLVGCHDLGVLAFRDGGRCNGWAAHSKQRRGEKAASEYSHVSSDGCTDVAHDNKGSHVAHVDPFLRTRRRPVEPNLLSPLVWRRTRG